MRESAKREALKRYQRAIQRQMENGARLPQKLAEYLESVKAKHATQTAASVPLLPHSR